MKFILESDVEFEAEDMDQALIKLALHFMCLMQSEPVLIINDTTPLDMIKVIKSGVQPLNIETTEGFINVDYSVTHEQPELMQ